MLGCHHLLGCYGPRMVLGLEGHPVLAQLALQPLLISPPHHLLRPYS
jgi:hypothetical protein